MGHAGDEFHLHPGKRLRAARPGKNERHASRQNREQAQTDGEVAAPPRRHRFLQGSGGMLSDKLPLLARGARLQRRVPSSSRFLSDQIEQIDCSVGGRSQIGEFASER